MKLSMKKVSQLSVKCALSEKAPVQVMLKRTAVHPCSETLVCGCFSLLSCRCVAQDVVVMASYVESQEEKKMEQHVLPCQLRLFLYKLNIHKLGRACNNNGL